MNEHNQHGPDSGHVWSQPCRIRRAVALIEANFAAKLSREEMARTACLSVSHFSRLFTQCMGLSPHQYLVRCRLRHAEKLLRTLKEGLAIVDVATASGFADQAHFSRHFRRAYGVSPMAYKRTTCGESENACRNRRFKNPMLLRPVEKTFRWPQVKGDDMSNN